MPANIDTKLEIALPFSGFYYSHHEQAIDDVIERLTHDDDGENDAAHEALLDTLSHAFHRTIELEYAAQYAIRFIGLVEDRFGLSLPSFTYTSLWSPREYNFHTDRIFGTISRDDAAYMLAHVDRAALEALIAERHSSCSGFVSFYSTDIADWLDLRLEYWDANMLETLLLAHCDGTQWSDEDIAGDMVCSGALDTIVWANLPQAALDILDDIDERKAFASRE